MTYEVCEQGSMRRKCETCDLAEENEQLRHLLREGVNLLRTTYANKGDFAHAAQMWVLSAEHIEGDIGG